MQHACVSFKYHDGSTPKWCPGFRKISQHDIYYRSHLVLHGLKPNWPTNPTARPANIMHLLLNVRERAEPAALQARDEMSTHIQQMMCPRQLLCFCRRLGAFAMHISMVLLLMFLSPPLRGAGPMALMLGHEWQHIYIYNK
jgi:hypothetical protein